MDEDDIDTYVAGIATAETADPADELETLLASVFGGRRHLTRSRIDRIRKSVTPILLKKWHEVVESLPSDDGAVVRRVIAAWEEAVLLKMVPDIPALTRGFGKNKTALIRYYVDKKTLWTSAPQGRPCHVGPRVHVSTAEFIWKEGAWDHSQPLAGPLFELVWDALYQRNEKQMGLTMFDVRWWTAAGGVLTTNASVMFAWPLADLPLFSKYERMAVEWSHACSQALKLYARFPDEDGGADDLAYWYVDYHHSLWHSKEVPRWKTGVGQDDWNKAISHLLYTPPDDGPFAEWIRAVPLLAAPESGLSPEAAAAILASAKLDDHKCKNLRALRRTRAQICLPDQDLEPALACIDATYPHHPWILLVENGCPYCGTRNGGRRILSGEVFVCLECGRSYGRVPQD